MAKEKICGIYRIENLINRENYIGQSIDIYTRWSDHVWALNNKKHNNLHLTRSWHKYGADNFNFTIIEQCNADNLNEREIYWIDYYDAYYNGYNQTKGGDGCLGKVWTEDEREKVSRSVLQLSLTGEIISRFININDAAQQTGVNSRQIWNCINGYIKKINNKESGRFTHKTASGYIWIYEDMLDDFNLDYYVSQIPQYAVYQYDLNWNLVKVWPSAESVKHIGYEPTTIRGVCKGDFMSAYGYLWSYEIDNLDEYILWFKNHFEIKYIGQYDLNGSLVKIWNSASETKQDGFNPCLVREVLRGRYFKHKKYIFKYISWNDIEITKWKGQLNYGKYEQGSKTCI